MSAAVVSSRLDMMREWRFVARGTCPAPRLPEHGIRASVPVPVGQGRLEMDFDGIDLLGF